MANKNREIVVNIISDASKFLKGYEHAISELEKYSKKADIASSMQHQINELKDAVKDVTEALSNMSTGKIDTKQLDELEHKLELQAYKIKTLQRNNKDIKIKVDESSGDKLDNILSNANTLLDQLHIKVEMLNNLGLNINPTGIKEINERANELNTTLESLRKRRDELLNGKNSWFENLDSKDATKELMSLQSAYENIEKQISDGALSGAELGKSIVQLGLLSKKMLQLRSQFQINDSQNFQLIDINILEGNIDKASNIVTRRINTVEKAITDLKSSVKEVVNVEFKDGKLTVPLSIEEDLNGLKRQATELIQQVQSAIWDTPLMVPLKFTSSYISKAQDELKILEDTVNSMGNSKKKPVLISQIENLKKQLKERDFRVEFKTNITELEQDINKGLIAIKKALKDARLYLYPEVTIDEESKKKIQTTLDEICKNLQLDLSQLGLNLEKLLGEEDKKQLQEAFKDFKIEITPNIKLTDKDIEEINKKLVKQLEKLEVKIDVTNLQNSLAKALDNRLIDSWGNRFISTIDKVCRKIDDSFGQLSQNQFYEAMKGWDAADKIQRDYRRGSARADKYTYDDKSAYGELERIAYANSKTGSISVSHIVDQLGTVSNEVVDELKRLYSGAKQIGDVYDTIIHSHPINNKYGLDIYKILTQNKSAIKTGLTESILSQMGGNNSEFVKTQLSQHVSDIYDKIFADLNPKSAKEFRQLFNDKLQDVLRQYFNGLNSDISKIKIDADLLRNLGMKAIAGKESFYDKPLMKSIGNDLLFSGGDLGTYYQSIIGDGIKKIMVESNGKINELDLSTVDERIVKAIVNEYKSKINSIRDDVYRSQYATKENGVTIFDASKRSEIGNQWLSDIITKQIDAFNQKNKTNYSTDASKYLKQYDIDQLKVTPENFEQNNQEVSQLVQLLNQMAASLTEINKKDFQLDTKSIDAISTKLEALLTVLKELNTQVHNFDFGNINISVEPIDKIASALENLSNMFQRTFNSFSDTDISNQWSKIQEQFNAIAKDDGNFDARKKEVTELIAEYQKYLDMGGKDPITNLTSNQKGQDKLAAQYQKYTAAQKKAAEESAKAVEKENKTLGKTKQSAKEAAKAKTEFTEANKNVKKSAEASSEAIQEEVKEFKNAEDVINNGQSATDTASAAIVSQQKKEQDIIEETGIVATNTANIVKNAEDVKQQEYEETANALEVLQKAQVGTANIFEKTKDAFNFGEDPHLAAKRFFEEYANNIAQAEGLAESKYTINTDNNQNFKYGQIEYYNEALKQTITETWMWHEANEQIEGDTDRMVVTNIKFVDNIRARYKQEQKDAETMAIALRKANEALTSFDSKTQGKLKDNAKYKELSALLANGFKNLDDVERAKNLMNELNVELNNINADARRGSASFDIFSNMVKGINEADNKVRLLTVDYQSLGDVSDEVTQKFDKLLQSLDILKNAKGVEEQAKAYGNYREALNEATYAIRIFKREQNLSNKTTASYQRDTLLSEDVETQKLQLGNLERTLLNSGSLTDELKSKFNELRAELDKVDSAYSNNLWKKSFQQLKLEISATTDMEKERSSALKEIIRLTKEIANKESKIKLLDTTTDIEDIKQLQAEIEVLQAKLNDAQTKFGNFGGYSEVDSTTLLELNVIWQKIETAERKALDKELFDKAEQDYKDLKKVLTDIVALNEKLAKATINGDNFSIESLTRDLATLESRANALQTSLFSNVRGLGVLNTDDFAALNKISDSFDSKFAPIKNKQFKELNALYEQLDKVGLLTDDLSLKFVELANKLNLVADNDSLSEWVDQFSQLKNTFSKDIIDDFKNIGNQINNIMSNGANYTGYENQFIKLNQLLNEYKVTLGLIDQTDDMVWIDGQKDVETYQREIQTLLTRLKQVASSQKSGWVLDTDNLVQISSIDQVIERIRELAIQHRYGKQIGEQYSKSGQEVTLVFKDQDGVITKVRGRVDELQQSMQTLTTTSKGAVGLFGNFGATLKHFAGQLAGYYLGTNDFIQYFRQGVAVVKEFDAAMTELIKVSKETESELFAFEKEAFGIAETIGSTGKEIINSAADWEKLGYAIDEASELAKNSALYANVGDMDIDTATEHMVSTLKAFNVEAEDSISLVDKFNEIGNSYAITSEGIGAALERSAASLVAAGNDIDESIALITAGNIISQDAESVGNAIKVLSLRIRGSKAELEEMGEDTDGLADSTSKLREELKSLTGVDIMLDDSTYKSTYEIILEISKVWDKLSDVSQATVLEKLAGKTRASVVAGLLQQGETLQKVFEDSQTAQGSALQENQKYLESVQGHLDKLNNKWQEMWTNAINRDAMNFFIDLGTIFLETIDKIGVFKSALIGTIGVITAKSVTKDSGGRAKKAVILL